MPASNQKILIATGVVALAGLGFYLYRRSTRSSTSVVSKVASGKNSETADQSQGNGNNGSPISKEELLQIFREFTATLEKVVFETAQYEQKVIKEIENAGAYVSQEQLKAHIHEQFTSLFTAEEKKIYAAHGTTQEQVSAATDLYEDDPDFQQASRDFKIKYAMFLGTWNEELPEHVTMESVLAVMREIMEGMTEIMEKHVKELRPYYNSDPDWFKSELNKRYNEDSIALREEVHKKHGFTRDDLQLGVVCFQQDPDFERSLTEMTNKQQERFQLLGIQS